MLILRRKAGEAIILNGVIKIIVLAVEGERVKLAFDCPPDVNVVRDEILNPDSLAPALRASTSLHAPCVCCTKTRCKCMLECDEMEVFCLAHHKLIAAAPFPIEAVS